MTTLALRTRDHLRHIADEIWADAHDIDADLEDADEDEESPEVAASRWVAGAVAELRDSVGEMSQTHRGLSKDQRGLFEGMAAVLGEVVGVVIKAQGEASEVYKSGHENLAATLAEMRDGLADDSKKMHASLSHLDQSVTKLAARVDDIVAALTAPRTLVTDKDGRPIGVKVGR